MSEEELIDELINVTKKIDFEKKIKERQAIINQCPYHKNKLNDVRPEQTIYRIERFNYFLDNVKNKQLYFSWPGRKEWKDIFDGVFVRTPIDVKKGDIVGARQSYDRDYFCQCWSCEELEIMWNLLSKNPYETVMIVSTTDKIMRQIWTDEFCGKYVGLVEYHPIVDMRKEDFFQSVLGQSWEVFNETGMARTFLFKPDSLSYEKEDRFIARMKVGHGQQKEGITVCISGQPQDYIDRILVDPRTSEAFESEVRKALSKYGLIVERSNKNRKDIEDSVISSYYQKSKDNYGLPKTYVFRE
ncbi:MAG: hypothetical protein ABSB91_05075 [Sedimentisphaerales bacterium]|jgi:hypothetical protein